MKPVKMIRAEAGGAEVLYGKHEDFAYAVLSKDVELIHWVLNDLKSNGIINFTSEFSEEDE